MFDIRINISQLTFWNYCGTVYPAQNITPGAGVPNGGYNDVVVMIPDIVCKCVVAANENKSVNNLLLFVPNNQVDPQNSYLYPI